MNLSYQEALDRCKQSFKTKLMHSVELLRKAERIALMYDNTDGYYLAFSGGKDSQALYHVAQLAGVKFKGHMSLTSVDPPQVIRFVKRQYPDVELIKPKMSMFDKAIERGILPTMRVRWCCADFKESAGAGKVTLIGVRAAESARRAKRHEVEVKSRKFSGDLEGFDAWSQAEIEKKLSKTKRKVNEDEFSVKTDNEVRCINGKDSILISPIFQWTEDDVWYFLNEIVNVPHCELYDMGYSRIGCILCPMSNKKSKQRDIKMFPHVKRGWIRAIKAIRSGGYSRKDSSGGTSQQNGCSKCSYGGVFPIQNRFGHRYTSGQFYETAMWIPITNHNQGTLGEQDGPEQTIRDSSLHGGSSENFSIAPLNK